MKRLSISTLTTEEVVVINKEIVGAVVEGITTVAVAEDVGKTLAVEDNATITIISSQSNKITIIECTIMLKHYV